jgi:hypothetical protein
MESSIFCNTGFHVPYPLAIALMMEAVRTSETSTSFYETTLRNIAEGCPSTYLNS